MKYDPKKHHRRSIRLKGYDYSQLGAYFVTVVTQDRACLFGAVANGEMQLNNAGQIAKAAWADLPARFPSVCLDAFMVMPNHVHGVIVVGAQFIAPRKAPQMDVGGDDDGVDAPAQFIAPRKALLIPSDGSGKGAINRAPYVGGNHTCV